MRLSNGQKQEIEFLSNEFKKFSPTEQEVEQFIEYTVYGKGKTEQKHGKVACDSNRLILAKRSLEISSAMWKQDITTGLLSVRELAEDYPSEYGKRFVKGLCKSITREYRMKQLQTTPRAEICYFVAVDNAVDYEPVV